MTTPRQIIGRMALPLVAAGALALVTYELSNEVGPVRYHSIESSYYFDVTNPSYVAGFSDAVIFGRVAAVDSVDPGVGETTYRFVVDSSMKGTLKGSVLLRQSGWREGRDVWVQDDQVSLAVGRTYAIAVRSSGSPGRYGVVGGPVAVREIVAATSAQARVQAPTTATAEDASADWMRAIATAKYPPTAP